MKQDFIVSKTNRKAHGACLLGRVLCLPDDDELAPKFLNVMSSLLVPHTLTILLVSPSLLLLKKNNHIKHQFNNVNKKFGVFFNFLTLMITYTCIHG